MLPSTYFGAPAAIHARTFATSSGATAGPLGGIRGGSASGSVAAKTALSRLAFGFAVSTTSSPLSLGAVIAAKSSSITPLDAFGPEWHATQRGVNNLKKIWAVKPPQEVKTWHLLTSWFKI